MRLLAFATATTVLAGCLLTAPSREAFEGGDAGSAPAAAVDAGEAGADAGVISVVYEGPGTVTAIAGAGGAVYFGLRDAPGSGLNSWRAGAATKTVATDVPTSIDVDAEFLFWTTAAPPGTVWRARRQDDAVRVSNPQPDPRSVTVGGQRVHWISQRTIVGADSDLTTRVLTLASDQASPASLSFANATLAWVNVDSGDLMARDLTSGTGPRVVLAAQRGATSLAIWDGALYYTLGGEVRRVNVDGTGATSIARGAKDAVAVDSTGIYWATGEGVRRRRLSSPGNEDVVASGRSGCDALIALESTGLVAACNASGRAVVLRVAK